MFLKKFSHYQIAIFLSSLSMVFGLLREFLIVGLLGFSMRNDALQVYLSIFYTIGLNIDAMRLSCLNLYTSLSLSRIIAVATVVCLPFCILIALLMNYSTHGANPELLIITIVGCYFNLIAALLITYKQRNNLFLSAQIINVLPNFILIPGIILCYLSKTHVVLSIISLTTAIPIVQCAMLLMLSQQDPVERKAISFVASVWIICRHFSAMLGEQLLQIIIRAAFFNYGTGFLSLYAMSVRIYSALRFILIDSYIGSRLATWKQELQNNDYYFLKFLNSRSIALILLSLSLIISMRTSHALLQSSLQITVLLVFGFYFSTLVRILYFRINRHETNAQLVWRFASYEMLFTGVAFILTYQSHYPLFALLWIGYVAKPFTQLLFLRRRFYELTTS